MNRPLTYTCLMLAVCLVVAGCNKQSGSTQPAKKEVAKVTPPPQPPPAPPPVDTTPPVQGTATPSVAKHVVRGQDLQAVRNQFSQLGVFYNQYVTEFGKPPAKADDFLEYIKRDDARTYRDIKEGRFVLNVGSPLSANSVLAYEKDKDIRGMRVVVFADRRVEMMDEQQLKAALGGKNP